AQQQPFVGPDRAPARPGHPPHAARLRAARRRHQPHHQVDRPGRGRVLRPGHRTVQPVNRGRGKIMRSCPLLVAAGAAAFLLLAARTAAAYPQFQFSSGTRRCTQCHYSPAGSGLITSWGRDEAGDTISYGGNGAFLHGAWAPPDWLALGGDVRLATTYNATGGDRSPEVNAFPMQAEAYGRAAF